MAKINTIGILAYEGCGEQDTLTVWEIFRSLVVAGIDPTVDIKLVHVSLGDAETVTMQMGLKVPHDGQAGDDLFDLFYVPGGLGSGTASQDKRILDIVRRHHEARKIVATNCSGISILHRAEILGNTPVTSAATVSRRLRDEGTNVVSPRVSWLGVPEDRLWTTAGGSAVHDSTVAMIYEYWGDDIGRQVALMWDTRGKIGDAALTSRQGPPFFIYSKDESELQDGIQDLLLPRVGLNQMCIHAPITLAEAKARREVYHSYLKHNPDLRDIEIGVHNEMIILEPGETGDDDPLAEAVALLKAEGRPDQMVEFPLHSHSQGEKTICLEGTYLETLSDPADLVFENGMNLASFNQKYPNTIATSEQADGSLEVQLLPGAQWSMGAGSQHKPGGRIGDNGFLLAQIYWAGENQILEEGA